MNLHVYGNYVYTAALSNLLQINTYDSKFIQY